MKTEMILNHKCTCCSVVPMKVCLCFVYSWFVLFILCLFLVAKKKKKVPCNRGGQSTFIKDLDDNVFKLKIKQLALGL